MEGFVAGLWSDAEAPDSGGATVDLVDFDPDGEEKVLVAMCYPYADRPEREVAARVARLSADERRALVRAYVGERANRRHRPGRALERTAYRFDIVSDYGAFRDLQRHRMLTIEWQPLGTALGWSVPEPVGEAGLEAPFVESMERSAELYELLHPSFPGQAAYAVALAFNIRYSMQLSAREAMHVLELRSGPQGHESYRRIAQVMHEQIAERAGHRAIAAAMAFVDHGGADLGRLDAEERSAGRRTGSVENSLDAAGWSRHE
jgi:hypothetical protein